MELEEMEMGRGVLRLVPIKRLEYAPWNYKEDDEELLQKVKESLRRHGQIGNLNVRRIGKDRYEVLDGNHRLKALKDLGIKQVVVLDHGELGDEAAKMIAVRLNEIRFSADVFKLSPLVIDLLQEESVEELAKTMPYSVERLKEIALAAEGTWQEFITDAQEGNVQEAEEKGVTVRALVLKEKVSLVMNEVRRIRALAKLNDSHYADGLALEKMCALSAAGD